MPQPTLDELRATYGPGIEEFIIFERLHGELARSKLASMFDELFNRPIH